MQRPYFGGVIEHKRQRNRLDAYHGAAALHGAHALQLYTRWQSLCEVASTVHQRPSG
jgi:hypothetical protein